MKYDHAQKAQKYFLDGYNCAQAVFCAFEDLTGLDVTTSARLASSFGGGMGRLREVCGTVSGALLVLGIVCGYDDPKAGQAKTDHYHLVQEFVRRFREINGTILCRELLEGVKTQPGNDPEARSWMNCFPSPLFFQRDKLRSYRTDLLEIRGVFRGFFAKNPSGTAFAPFAKRIQHGRTQVTALRSNDSAPRGGVFSNVKKRKGKVTVYPGLSPCVLPECCSYKKSCLKAV